MPALPPAYQLFAVVMRLRVSFEGTVVAFGAPATATAAAWKSANEVMAVVDVRFEDGHKHIFPKPNGGGR